MSKTVRHRIDPANLPPLTEKQKVELAALALLPDGQIDTSDIPSQGKAFWANASPGQFYKPVKASTTVRLDADVLAWLKGQGRGYQTRINTIIRDAMIRATTRKSSIAK